MILISGQVFKQYECYGIEGTAEEIADQMEEKMTDLHTKVESMNDCDYASKQISFSVIKLSKKSIILRADITLYVKPPKE